MHKCEKDFQEAVQEYAGSLLKLSIDKLSKSSSGTVKAAIVVVDDVNPLAVSTEVIESDCEEPPEAKRRKLERPKFDEICKMLSAEHEKLYGVECAFKVVDENKDIVIHCSFCGSGIKPQKGRGPGSHQPFMEHIRRQGHRVNVMSLCSRDGLTAENFDDVELKEIMAIRLLEAKAPGVFQVKKRDDGQLFAECRFCGSLKRVKLFPKSSSLEARISGHLSGKPHATASKSGQQTRISAYTSTTKSSPSNLHH